MEAPRGTGVLKADHVRPFHRWPTDPPKAVRELPTATQILGIGRAVAERIASLDPLDVQRIAKAHFRELKPRWEENLNFWQTLLLAALKDDEASLFDAYQEGTQLLFTDVLPGVR